MQADPRRYRRYKIRIPVELGAAGRMQVVETEDLSQGGCRLGVLFPMQAAELVRVRLRADRVPSEPSGSATVAWSTKNPPYHVGLKFADPLVEQMPGFLRALLGPVQLVTAQDQPKR